MSNLNISEIIDNSIDKLIKKQNVIGMAQGTKIVNSIDTKETCVTVFVSQKVPKDNLAKEDIIPKEVENVKTDVIEIGTIKANNLIEKVRPMNPGYCISPYDAMYSGTAGCIVSYKNAWYILSNNHVLANQNNEAIGAKILQPSVPYGGKADTDTVALLTSYVKIKFAEGDKYPINYMDAAIAKVINKEDIAPEIYEMGKVNGVNINAKVGDIVKKTGMSSRLTYGKIIYTNASILVGFSETKSALFVNQIITTSMIIPGDSGSLVLDDNNYSVGLAFAGSSVAGIVTPINTILNEFGVTMV